MPDKKPIDSEIVKALECCHGQLETDCENCPNKNTCDEIDVIQQTVDLINRLQAENSNLTSDLTSLQNDLTSAKAEIERLKNAYKQVAWERDIFAEDMKQEIKKDCSYLMLDIKTIKAEAYKECIGKVKEEINKHSYGVLHKIVINYKIDNLLKELVGEDNASKN